MRDLQLGQLLFFPFRSIHLSRQFLQKVCPQFITNGFVRMSVQIEHCSRLRNIFFKRSLVSSVMVAIFESYSPVRMKFNRNNVSFNFWGCTKTIKKCNIPLKSPIKWLPKMQHFFLNSNFCYVFRAIFGKLMFLKNGHGRHEKGGMPTHYVVIFHEFH